MADAVSEEIDELKQNFDQQIDFRMSQIANRLQNTQLGVDKGENEIQKISFEVDKLREDILQKLP